MHSEWKKFGLNSMSWKFIGKAKMCVKGQRKLSLLFNDWWELGFKRRTA